MKKLFLIIFLSVISISFSYSDDRHLFEFNKSLFDNGYDKYLEENECYGCDDYSTRTIKCLDKNGDPKKQCLLDGKKKMREGSFDGKKKENTKK